jgi:hypothetical protein
VLSILEQHVDESNHTSYSEIFRLNIDEMSLIELLFV